MLKRTLYGHYRSKKVTELETNPYAEIAWWLPQVRALVLKMSIFFRMLGMKDEFNQNVEAFCKYAQCPIYQ